MMHVFERFLDSLARGPDDIVIIGFGLVLYAAYQAFRKTSS